MRQETEKGTGYFSDFYLRNQSGCQRQFGCWKSSPSPFTHLLSFTYFYQASRQEELRV